MHRLRGGASFQRTDVEGGQVFSAPESRNSSAPPVPINNDRSLTRLIDQRAFVVRLVDILEVVDQLLMENLR